VSALGLPLGAVAGFALSTAPLFTAAPVLSAVAAAGLLSSERAAAHPRVYIVRACIRKIQGVVRSEVNPPAVSLRSFRVAEMRSCGSVLDMAHYQTILGI
jgi:hypothetical protein